MSFEQDNMVRYEDVVINDDEIVLPPKHNAATNSCQESQEIPKDLLDFMEAMGLTLDDLISCEFREYNEEGRGSVSGGLQDGFKCTTDYLEAIRYNYCLTKWCCGVRGNTSPEEIEELFSPIVGEIDRLQKHSELFPNPEVRQAFWHDLEKALEEFTHGCFLIHEHDKRQAAFVSSNHKEWRARSMPGRDFARKLWEQYIHNRAPGVNVDLSDMGGDGSIQILPMGALRLLFGMKQANESIIRGIEAARRARGVDIPYQVGPGNPAFLGVNTISPEGNRRTHKLRSDLLQSIQNGSRLKSRSFADTDLEILNEDFTKLMKKRRGLRGRAAHWNFMCLVIHDHPSYA